MLSHWRLERRGCATRTVVRRAAERGMTLVEIMVVVIIISLVAGVVGVQVFNQLAKAQVQTARTQMKSLGDALELYKLSNRQYPSTAEGLNALASPKGGEQPYMATIPKDPWGNDYIYIFPGSHNPKGFDIFSKGADGAEGGDDDVGNWESGK
jgi:general secretion pathway protein G